MTELRLDYWGPGLTDLMPISFHSKLKGTIKDENGNPLVRKISVFRENQRTGLVGFENFSAGNVALNITMSNADGTFEVAVDETLPVTLVVFGEDGENDQIIKNVKVVI